MPDEKQNLVEKSGLDNVAQVNETLLPQADENTQSQIVETNVLAETEPIVEAPVETPVVTDEELGLARKEVAEPQEPNNTPVQKFQKHAAPKQKKGLQIALRVGVGLVAAVLLVTIGMLTGAMLQKKGEVQSEQVLSDGQTGDGGVDLAVGLLMNQLQNKDKNGGSVEIPVDQLVDGSGGGKLVGKLTPLASDDKLTLELLKLHNNQENSCYSPLSIRYALEMMYTGANGETKTQIANLLGSFGATRYENIADHLSLANSLWIRDDWDGEVRTSYEEALKDEFDAEIKRDNFQSAANVNQWIENKSFGMLQNVVPDYMVQSSVTLLANVLAIDMDWENRYDELNTSGEFFNYDHSKEDDENIKYTTMKRSGGQDIYYNLASEATVLAQDLKEYNGTRLQFVAIMPDNLQEFIKNVNNNQINRLLLGLRQAVAQNDTYQFGFTAYVPRFVIKGGIEELKKDLNTLGVVDAFDETKADFSLMTESPFTFESMVHRTMFDFNERGIKAAAVTVGGGKGAGGYGPIPNSANIVISIHKPFMYLVRDVKTGEIWFAGTVYEPNRWEDDKASYNAN